MPAGLAPAPGTTLEPPLLYPPEEELPPQQAAAGTLNYGQPATPAPAQPVEAAPVAEPPSQQQGALNYGQAATPAAPIEGEAPPPEPVPTMAEAGGQLGESLENVTKAITGGKPEEILPSIGGVKDAAGTAMSAMGGDILPWRRGYTNVLAGMAGAPPTDPIGQKVYTAYGGGTSGEIQETFLTALEHDPKVQEASANGYVDPATGTTFVAGPEAAWEAWVSDKPVWERAFLDFVYDPSSLTLVAAPLAAAAKATKVPGLAGTALRAGGKAVDIADDALALGLNQVVGGGLTAISKGLKATGITAPTKTQKIITEGEEVLSSASNLAAARSSGGQLAPTTVEDLAPGVVRLSNADPLIDPVIYKTDGRQITTIVDDPANLASGRPLTMGDHEKLLNLISRADPADQTVLMNTGGRQLLQPDAAVAKPYLKTLQSVLPKTPTGPMRGAVPVPTSGPELLTLRSKLAEAVTNSNAGAVRDLTLAAKRSNLLPASTPPTATGVQNAIGAFEAARKGTPLIDPAVHTAVNATLRGHLDSVGLSDVGLNLQRVLTNIHTGAAMPQVEGQYLNSVISLAESLAGSADEATLAARLGDVLNHEVIHAQRHFGLYRDVEWRSLSEMARSSKVRGDKATFLDEVTARYDAAFAKGEIPVKLTPAQLEEEAVAEMYRSYMAGTLVATDVQKNLLQKIAAFFTAMARSIQGARPGQVLANIQSGKIGARQRPAHISVMSDPYTAYRRNMSDAPIATTPVFADPRNPNTWNYYEDKHLGNGWHLAVEAPEAAHATLTDLTNDLLMKADPETGELLYDRVQGLIDGSVRLTGKSQQIWEQSFLAQARGGPALMAAQIDRAAELTWRDRTWYEKTVQDFQAHYDLPPVTEGKTYNVTSATSGQTKPESNVGRTLSIMSNWLRGADDFTPVGGNRGVRAALTGGEEIGSDKFGSFARTFLYLAGLSDEVPKATIDLQMMKVFGMNNVEGVAANSILAEGETGQQLYDFFSDYMEGVRDLLNAELTPGDVPWQTWQVQAALWSAERQRTGVQGLQQADDAGIWFKNAADWMRQQGIIPMNGKVTAEALADPRVTEKFGETNNFWQNAPWFTLESRTTNTTQGAAAGEIFERLFAIPVHQLSDADLRREVDLAINTYRGDERRALKSISEGSGSPVQNLLRAITGRTGLQTSMIRNDALGAYEGQIGVNMRLPLQSANIGSKPGLGVQRLVYDDTQIRGMLALTSLGMDQSAAAASHFKAAPLGQHNTWTVRIPSSAQIEGNPRLEQALAGFTRDVGWPTSIHYDPSGILIDLHVFDPSGLPPIEQIMDAGARHLETAFGMEGTVLPRTRSDYFLETGDYRTPILQTLQREIADPTIARMESHAANLRKKVGKNARPEQLAATEESILRARQASTLLYGSDDITPQQVDRFIEEMGKSVETYRSSGAGKALGPGAIETKRLSSLEQGWNGIRSAASQRDADAAAFAERHGELAERAERQTVFDEADAGALNAERLRQREAGQITAPVDTHLGPSYSIVKAKGYHGSPAMDLNFIASDLKQAKHAGYGATRLGAFFSGDINEAAMYAGRGSLYEAELTLQKPYHTTMEFIHNTYGFTDMTASMAAEAFREDLTRQGYDGIIAWDSRKGVPALAADGTIASPYDPADMREIITFGNQNVKKVPKYSITKGQSGVPYTSSGTPTLPGVYKRGSVQEYMNTVFADADRHVMDVEYEFGGKKEFAWQRLFKEQENAWNMRELAIKKQGGAALTPKEEGQLGTFLNGLKKQDVRSDNLANWSDSAIDNLSGRRTQRFVEQAKGLRDVDGQLIDPSYYKGLFGKGLKAYDNFAGFRRTMSLYSTTRGPAYVLMQAIGNAFTLAVADPASLNHYSPIEQRRIVNSARGKGPTPQAYNLRNKTGLGQSETLGSSRDQLAIGNQANKTFFEKSTNPIVKGIGKIIASPRVKENADAFDGLLRHTAWRSAFEPGHRALVQGLPDRAARALAESSARSGVPSPLTGDVFADAVRGLGPYFSGAELRKALVESAGTANPIVGRAAERVARDYINDLRTLDKAALANVNRVGFDFAETRADAVLSRLFMFHYWMSRASVLYLREAAANPWQAQLWSRAMNAANKKVEAGIPEWQKNWQEFMASPAGIVGLWNPVSLIGTYLMMREDSEKMPWEDLTKAGEFLQTGFVSNLMLNPLLQGAIYVTGAGGSDFNPPDLLGTGKWTGDINTWLEKANRDVSTFYATEQGNPKVVPNIDARSLLGWVADQITQRGWEADFMGMAPISSYDPNTSEQANMAWFIHDQVLTEHPELNDGTEESAKEVASQVEEALANPDSPLYQAAADNLVDMYTMGPGSGRGNAFLDIAGYYGRQVLPFGITAQVTSRREKQIRSNRDEGTAADKEMGYVDDATPEARKLSIANDAVSGVWDPASSQLKEIQDGIKNGTLPMDAIMIEGKAWTNDELLSLQQVDRDTLAKYWLTYPQEQLGGRSGREILDATYAEQDEVLEQYPEIKDYRAFGDYVADYPGGPLAAIQDTAAINSNYRRFLEGLPGGLTEAEYITEATSYGAFHGGIQGVKLNRYDANPLQAGKGQIAGVPQGESLSDWQEAHPNEDTDFTSKKQKVEAGLETFNQASEILNGYDTLWGLQPGTLSAQYASEIAGGGYASDQIYGLLKDGGMSDEQIRPRTDEDKAAPITWYLKWATENGVTPGSDSISRFVAEDDRRFLGPKVADINAGIYADPNDEYTIKAEERSVVGGGTAVGSDEIYTPPAKEGSGIGNVLGGMVDAVGNFFANLTGHNSDPPVKPTVAPEKISTKILGSPDGIGVKSDPDSDRTWMEDMIGPWHAAVTTDYKGPKPAGVDYSYQLGHGADDMHHAAYDISCDDPNGNCVGTPMTSPITGKVVCAGYGQGTGEAIGSPNCTYSQNTTLPGQAHTIVVEAGTDVEGNKIQLSFNHMGTSNVTAGQVVNAGDPLGTMGNTDAGPHVHLEGWGVCPGQGYAQDWVVVDPHLVVSGYYDTNSVCP